MEATFLRAHSAGPFAGDQRQNGSFGASSQRRPSRQKSSTAPYVMVAVFTAAALFFVLWWIFMVSGDESPWIPAGLAAAIVMLISLVAREAFSRRAHDRSHSTTERRESHVSGETAHHRGGSRTLNMNSAALRAIQKQSSEADAGNLPDLHLETFRACRDYLDNSEELLKGGEISRESRAALRSGQERVRALERHHMLSWARTSSAEITQDAQLRVRLSDKIETALRAISVIKAAQKYFPEELELAESVHAINEYIASAQVAHWVELAERNAFRGQYRRAIDRYRDALFYLARGEIREELRIETAEKIGREIELLRARLRVSRNGSQET
jgi:hypothetical protein